MAKKNFLLRIDTELWQQLQAMAVDQLRSVNGQIEYLLRQAVNSHRKQVNTEQNPDPQK